MKSQTDILRDFEDAVMSRDPNILDKAFQKATASGLAMDLVLKALTDGLNSARMKLQDHSSSIPEFLLSVDVMRQGLDMLKTLQPTNKDDGKASRIIIGVVEGDVHDLGKNIVAGVLQACGYDVIDLGRNVPPSVFIEEAKKTRAALVAVSTMMSTPLENMREVVAWCKRDLPHVAVLVGGAPLDEEIARSFGADGYAESAVNVPEETRRVLEGL